MEVQMDMANADDTKTEKNLEANPVSGATRHRDGMSKPAFGDPQVEDENTGAAGDDANKGGKPFAFSDLDKPSAGGAPGNIEFILDIPIEITVQLGRAKMLIDEMLKLGQGSVIELSKLAGETLDVLANQKLIARGEVVVVDEKYGIRLTEIVSHTERIESLK
jgi:flagellar motor switch protein FliN/FliY